MIKTRKEMRCELREHYRGGAGSLHYEHLLEAEEYGGLGRLFGRLTLSPGGTVPYHLHTGDMEILYALSGRAEVSEDDVTYRPLAAGDIAVVRSGQGHAMRAVGDAPFVYLAVVLFEKQA